MKCSYSIYWSRPSLTTGPTSLLIIKAVQTPTNRTTESSVKTTQRVKKKNSFPITTQTIRETTTNMLLEALVICLICRDESMKLRKKRNKTPIVTLRHMIVMQPKNSACTTYNRNRSVKVITKVEVSISSRRHSLVIGTPETQKMVQSSMQTTTTAITMAAKRLNKA